MNEASHPVAYMHVKSARQGTFLDDESRAGKGKSLCLSVKYRGDLPHDVRGGHSYAVLKHQPIAVVREWSRSTPQFLMALWTNEVLDEVQFEFVRQSGAGKEVVYATLTLTHATVAYVEAHAGEGKDLASEGWRPLEVLGLDFQKIAFKYDDGTGMAEASYDATRR